MVKQNQRQKSEKPSIVPADSVSEMKFKGVRKRKWGKYVSEVRLPNSRERIWLGSYDTAEKAARAFDAALFLLRGRNAKFNFPDCLPDVAAGSDGSRLTPSEIQLAASKFANSDTLPYRSEPAGPGSASEALSLGDSPSPNSSRTADSDLTAELDGQSTEAPVGSGDDPIDFGMFPGIEDFPSDFYGIGMGIDSSVDGGSLAIDEFLTVDPFLWSF